MATAAELRARRDALTAQRSSGVARVSYDGKTVDYRSVAEIDRAIEALDREIAAAEGRRIVRQLRVTTAVTVRCGRPGTKLGASATLLQQRNAKA
jgi:hypothetical protein